MICRSRSGFTLVELLVVITIIGLLMTLVLPAFNSVREFGRKTQCANNLHEVGVAYQHFISKKDGGGKQLQVAVWRDLLKPYLENRGDMYLCPNDRGPWKKSVSLADYAFWVNPTGGAGWDGISGPGRPS